MSASSVFQNVTTTRYEEVVEPKGLVYEEQQKKLSTVNSATASEATENSESEMNFFDSIDNSFDIDKDDSLLMNSSYYCEELVPNEAMAEIDSLEVRLNQLD